MKKGMALLLAAFMLLAGCAGDASVTAPAPSSESAGPASLPQLPSIAPEPVQLPQVTPVDFDALTTGQRITLFAANTTAGLLDGGQNLCYSPLSLYMALALVGMGAEGATLDELLAVLQAEDSTPDALAAEMAQIMKTLPFTNGHEEPEPVDGADVVHDCNETLRALAIANSVWVNDSWQLLPAFEAVAGEAFRATAQSVRFDDAATARLISDWVGEQTNGLLAPEYSFPPRMGLALVNTLFLADAWTDTFHADSNTEDVFHAEDGEVDCTYMNGRWPEKFYYRGAEYTGLSLDLLGQGGVYGEMAFILPDEGVPTQALLQDPALLFDIMTGGWQGAAKVTLQLPKFAFSSVVEPTGALQALGLNALFELAELPGLAQPAPGHAGNPLHVSSIRQDCRIAIDEEGVQAASATIMAVPEAVALPAELEELHLVFDRPFLFIVSYNQLPLFVGVVANPAGN